jgi:hypothetical protein
VYAVLTWCPLLLTTQITPGCCSLAEHIISENYRKKFKDKLQQIGITLKSLPYTKKSRVALYLRVSYSSQEAGDLPLPIFLKWNYLFIVPTEECVKVIL